MKYILLQSSKLNLLEDKVKYELKNGGSVLGEIQSYNTDNCLMYSQLIKK
ncbi:hypothetical protein [Aquimarina sp. AU58]|nr:hypothetical protein [Aquimarina sp. AU58]